MKRLKRLLGQLLVPYHRLSILKKFLLAPVAGLVFVLPFVVYIFTSTASMQAGISNLDARVLPLYEKTVDAIVTLEKIQSDCNSAVMAKEKQWLQGCSAQMQSVAGSFENISKGRFAADIDRNLQAFATYYKKAMEVSTALIGSNYSYERISQDTKELMVGYEKVHQGFVALKSRLKSAIKSNNQHLAQTASAVFEKGLFIFLVWFVISVLLLWYIYNDLKNRIKTITKEANSIALGKVDFATRMEYDSSDELGGIVDSINTFIGKLHSKHRQLDQANQKLHRLYKTDALTGLYNRNKIDEVFTQQLQMVKRYDLEFSIILLDIDYFKNVNDVHGHLTGDAVLKTFAKLLKSRVRGSDTLGGWGGEEFIILCPHTNKHGAYEMAQKLLGCIRKHYFDKIGSKTASFGVAQAKKDDDTDALISRADTALYKAKENGRNCVMLS